MKFELFWFVIIWLFYFLNCFDLWLFDYLIVLLFDYLIIWLFDFLIFFDYLIIWLFDCLFVWLFDCLIIWLFDYLIFIQWSIVWCSRRCLLNVWKQMPWFMCISIDSHLFLVHSLSVSRLFLLIQENQKEHILISNVVHHAAWAFIHWAR